MALASSLYTMSLFWQILNREGAARITTRVNFMIAADFSWAAVHRGYA